ncbi:phosphopentomutase [Thermodesulfitimonas autotrophica]|uniref:Phosphopentomutase n=1 Tax=Thermodesulfitimonas autotrophica TaxID=1894989 RepID=A0A3N5BZW1_9THEO|nr:phosphopentomutase [Thermodesulfitimonas autotrophica]RPF49421.1 phosphopentomutase [Thermodesulfitimonas autotrophica]
MSLIRKVTIVVLDGTGIGALPDAGRYGDEGSNTLGNLSEAVGGLKVPHLQQLGLGNIGPIKGVPPAAKPVAAWGKMAERSPGKDTTTGHWEIAGVILDRPFPVYPNGFPPEIITAFEERIGRRVLGNKPASGTAIIEELGAEHMRTGYPIVYTSADSVFQIAAHEEVIPVAELYRMCEIARSILTGEHAVARVIARPFVGQPGNFRRTERRHDFSLPPPRPTLLEALTARGYTVAGIGKVSDIFAGRGITQSIPVKNNTENIRRTIEAVREMVPGIVFTNLVDFDTLYGHRNDPVGFARALEEFDAALPELMAAVAPDGVLFITADHGCDPTTPSTDHSREYVPLLVWGPRLREGVALGVRVTFADVAATIAEFFDFTWDVGESFAQLLVSLHKTY